MTNLIQPDLFKPEEVAARLRVSPGTVRARVREGVWPSTRIGRLLLFSEEQIQEIKRLEAVTPIQQAPRRRKAS